VVTEKVPAVPATKVVAPRLVIAGDSLTVSVNGCLASGRKPLAAVIVSG
jgi:hypothetical protein